MLTDERLTRPERARREGAKQSLATLLEAQLRHRFGTLSEAQQSRLHNATQGELGTLGLRLLDAKSLDDVFSG